GDVGELANIMRSPELGAIGGADEVGLNAQFVAMLSDASHEDGADLQRLANFLGIILIVLETEDGAARHDFEVGELRKGADEALGQAVAQVLVVGVGGGVDEGQDGDGSNLLGFGLSAGDVHGEGSSGEQYDGRDSADQLLE